jgi:hypothetical protein
VVLTHHPNKKRPKWGVSGRFLKNRFLFDKIAKMDKIAIIIFILENLMLTLTKPLTSSEVQNNFGAVIDKSQKEMISVTRRGRVVSLMMSPQVLEDYIDGILATKSKELGLHTAEQSKAILDKYR